MSVGNLEASQEKRMDPRYELGVNTIQLVTITEGKTKQKC